MNDYADREYIDSTEIFNKATDISKQIIIIQTSLSNINNYIDSLNDEKIWYSPAANYLKERFIKERNNLEIVYNELLNYLKHLFSISSVTDEMQKKVTGILNEVETKKIWDI